MNTFPKKALVHAQEQVAAFMRATDQPVRVTPVARIPQEEFDLRLRLHAGEVMVELPDAMERGDIVDIADAIGDGIFVLLGTANSYGINMEPIWQAIDRANMAKVDSETGKVVKDEGGKVLKPKDWVPPEAEHKINLAQMGFDFGAE